MLGTCPTIAITTAVSNGVGMGLAATFVLVGSNLVISLLRNFIPEKARIPAYVVVIATFVTMVDLLMKAYLPALNQSLGIFIPLIVVNCIIPVSYTHLDVYKRQVETARRSGIDIPVPMDVRLMPTGRGSAPRPC